MHPNAVLIEVGGGKYRYIVSLVGKLFCRGTMMQTYLCSSR